MKYKQYYKIEKLTNKNVYYDCSVLYRVLLRNLRANIKKVKNKGRAFSYL